MRLIFKVKKFCLKPVAPKLRLSAEETSVHALNDRQKQSVLPFVLSGATAQTGLGERANSPRHSPDRCPVRRPSRNTRRLVADVNCPPEVFRARPIHP